MKETAGKNDPKKSKAVQVDMPSPWQKYANVVLIPVIIGLSAFLLIRFRMNAAEEARNADQQTLTEINTRLANMRQFDISRMQIPPGQLATYRNSNHSEVEKLINSLLESTKDPVIRAETLVAKGDLNWLTATFPELPGATTNPSLQTKQSTAEYLAAATAAYTTVLKDYPTNQIAAVSARLGLGAIAENKLDWQEARKQYQAVLDDKTVPLAFSEVATSRMEIIKTIQDPVYMGTAKSVLSLEEESAPPTTQATQPTTRESSTTKPTTAPSTQPAM